MLLKDEEGIFCEIDRLEELDPEDILGEIYFLQELDFDHFYWADFERQS